MLCNADRVSVPSIAAEGRCPLISVAQINLHNLVGPVDSTHQVHIVDTFPAVHHLHVEVTVNRELPENTYGVFAFDGLKSPVRVEIAFRVDRDPSQISSFRVNILQRQVVPD